MNLNKHIEFFNPIKIDEETHIIGVGAIGSNLALMLARLGLTDIHLYDFDIVEEKNVANQNYFKQHVGQPKVEVTKKLMQQINPDIEVTIHKDGWTDQTLYGYLFLCLDNIDTRRAILQKNKGNRHLKAVFDFRMGLADAQHYAANWQDTTAASRLLETMAFTHEEAKKALPVSACGTTLSILPTIWTVVSAGVANFINYVKEKGYKHTILINPFDNIVDAF